MNIVPEPIEFEWDQGNREKNLEKHQVTWQEAEEVFFNSPLILNNDIRHSKKEKRYFALGKTNRSRLLFVSFTIRENKLRIISIRDMSRKEVLIYEKA